MSGGIFEVRLQRIMESASLSGSDPKLSAADGIVELASRPSGMTLHVIILLLLVVPPALIVARGQEVSDLVIASLWLIVMGSTFFRLFAADTRAVFDTKERSVTVTNINPVILLLRRAGLPLHFRWEDRYDWTSFDRLRLEYKVRSKTLSAHRIVLMTPRGGKVPVTEFDDETVARQVAHLISEMTGVEYH